MLFTIGRNKSLQFFAPNRCFQWLTGLYLRENPVINNNALILIRQTNWGKFSHCAVYNAIQSHPKFTFYVITKKNDRAMAIFVRPPRNSWKSGFRPNWPIGENFNFQLWRPLDRTIDIFWLDTFLYGFPTQILRFTYPITPPYTVFQGATVEKVMGEWNPPPSFEKDFQILFWLFCKSFSKLLKLRDYLTETEIVKT